MWAWLKKASDTEKERSTSRSRWSSENGRLKLQKGTMKSTHSGIQM